MFAMLQPHKLEENDLGNILAGTREFIFKNSKICSISPKIMPMPILYLMNLFFGLGGTKGIRFVQQFIKCGILILHSYF